MHASLRSALRQLARRTTKKDRLQFTARLHTIMDITITKGLTPKHTTPQQVLIPVSANGSYMATIKAVSQHFGLDATSIERDFKAERGELLLLSHPGQRIGLLGFGEQARFADLLKTARSFAHKHAAKLDSAIRINLCFAAPEAPERWVEAITNGLLLGTYQIGKFRSEPAAQHPLAADSAAIEWLVPEDGDAPALQAAAQRAVVIAAAQLEMLDLVNAPGNKKTATDLANWALQSGRQHGYQVTVMDKAEIEAQGLHALLAVNRGSEEPPTFIVMEYKPDVLTAQTIGLVGKGVTFDTGGLSIKPSANLHYMKSDMGGAAAVFGAMEAVARLRLPVHLVAAVPATDNCVDATAIKPGDLIGSHSGKTIEIIDTDAEGRLILADGLSYLIRHFKPAVLIDLATLTGSSVRALGYQAAALFTNNDDLAAAISRHGEQTGERVWRLPLWDEYKDDIKSDVADLRNFSGRPVAGAISAAKFLEAFTEEHAAWAHLDIAGVAFGDSEFSSQKSATAYGIRLLVEFLSDYAEEKV